MKLKTLDVPISLCLLTEDSLLIKSRNHVVFIILVLCLYVGLLFELFNSYNGLYVLGLFGMAFIIRNPFYTEKNYTLGIGPELNYGWSLPLGFSSLICVDGHIFIPEYKMARLISHNLSEFKEFARG
ncbi:MAG: hypothetical protein ACSHWU_13185 [Marinicella sp.]